MITRARVAMGYDWGYFDGHEHRYHRSQHKSQKKIHGHVPYFRAKGQHAKLHIVGVKRSVKNIHLWGLQSSSGHTVAGSRNSIFHCPQSEHQEEHVLYNLCLPHPLRRACTGRFVMLLTKLQDKIVRMPNQSRPHMRRIVRDLTTTYHLPNHSAVCQHPGSFRWETSEKALHSTRDKCRSLRLHL